MKTVPGVAGAQHVMHFYGELLPEKRMHNVARICQRTMVAAGHHIEKGEGGHTLRRSVARAYFDARVAASYHGALRETAALLHHASTTTTEIYLGLQSERLGRDKAMRGQRFLTSMVSSENVASMRSA